MVEHYTEKLISKHYGDNINPRFKLIKLTFIITYMNYLIKHSIK